MARLYGNVINRIQEGRTIPEIKVGTDITMYHWSDRTCYYVTEVIDQKNIKVKEYEVVADRDLPGGMGHQNWKYFKTKKECNDYLKQYGLGYDGEVEESPEEEWSFRYNHWKRVHRYDQSFVDNEYLDKKKMCEDYGEEDRLEEIFNNWYNYVFTKNEQKKLKEGKEVKHYSDLSGKVSFGVRNYYYDWEF